MRKSLLVCALSVALFAQSFTAYAAPSAQAAKVAETTVQASQGFSVLNQQVHKSPTDKAIYQGIKLTNGMTVLLISDPAANKSLMSVAVGVGSLEDPKSQQGLAHYLEHMIFMGSKNFPETNGLDQFLTKNGGYDNASTAETRTAYYLEVNNNAFDEAVTRFADMLAQPLLSDENAKKELNAVNAEMVRSKANDGWLMESVQASTSNPEHPSTKFSVGNKETLSDKPDSKLHDELVKFYQQYYSANLMNAVLYSNQSIEQLAKLAESTLGKMANKNVVLPEITQPLYREQDKGVIISYKPIKPNKSLEITFDFPNDKGNFKNKSYNFLSYVFSNNSEGTLSDYLIKNGLSDSGVLSSGQEKLGRNESEFSIYVALTDKGWAEKDKIISLIFQQIERIKAQGIQESYFNELKTSLSQSFEHLQVEKSASYIEGLADQMLLYPLENIIDADFLAEKMDKAEIAEKLDGMTLDNARIFLTGEVKTDKQTPYMQAGYSVEKITNTQKAQWLNFAQNPDIALPKLNPYFATDFALNTAEKDRLKPKLIDEKQGLAVYAMPSHYFPTDPKANISLDFSVANRLEDAKSQVASVALTYMSDLAQAEIASQAAVAGMGYKVAFTPNGISLGANGYTQHLAQLVEDVLAKVAAFPLTQANLEQAKQRILETFDRAEKEDSLRQATRVFTEISRTRYFSYNHYRQAVKALTLDDIAKMRERLLTASTGLQVLSVGNLADEQVNALVAQVGRVVHHQTSQLEPPRYIDFRHLSDKVNVVQNVPHEDSTLSLVYMVKGDDELANTTNAALLKNIIGRWYFDDLRTEKQLGYVVSATSVRVGKSSGLQFVVQSPNATPKEIMQHNQHFFNATLARLEKMSESEFEQYRASLLDKLQQKPESLNEEFDEYTFDFARDNSQFDRTAQRISALKKATKQEMVNFYKQAVIEQQGFVMASQAIGSKARQSKSPEAMLKGFKTVKDLEKFHQGLPQMTW